MSKIINLKETPTSEQKIDFQDEIVKLLLQGKKERLTIRQMSVKVQEYTFECVKDLREENVRLGNEIKRLQRQLSQQQGSLL